VCAATPGAVGDESCFDVSQLLKHLDKDTAEVYLKARENVVVSEALREQEQGHNRMLQEMELQLAQVAEGQERKVLLLQRRVVEEILTLKCPRPGCMQAFFDFDGCFALTCSRCGCGFCAYCLEDCGRDAHRHVANCRHNTAPGRDLFGDKGDFDRAQLQRRTRLVNSFLANEVQADLRALVVQVLRRDLTDLGIGVGSIM